MRAVERESLRRRFRFRCGYCGVAEAEVGAELTLDHFQPRSRGGADEPDNWVYCCHPCNEFKGDFWHDEPAQRLLHPLRDNAALHMVEDNSGTLRPLTPRGAAHIDRLHLNRPQLVAYR
jgi:5-methylcytosine-specific restriction endonuclease McrA